MSAKTKQSVSHSKNMKIMKCSCSHESQDEIHGNGMRAFNATAKKSGEKIQYRCTVCGKTHDS